MSTNRSICTISEVSLIKLNKKKADDNQLACKKVNTKKYSEDVWMTHSSLSLPDSLTECHTQKNDEFTSKSW